MKPKTKTGSAVEAVAQLPTADTLASLAAQSRFAKLPGARAAQAALELWRESQAAIAREQRQLDFCREHLRQPKAWPASFTEFLRCIVPGKDSGEREQHFAEFIGEKVRRSPWLHGTDSLDAKGKLTKEFKATAFNRESWQVTALEFRRYWEDRKSKAKSRAGKQGAAAKADKARP
jgi:hypothetical protein